MTRKRSLLCVYDYGQGGVWLLMDAAGPQEVEERYPMLKVFEDRPDWMTPEERNEYVARCEEKGFHWDIDQEPTGWLRDLDETSTHN